MTDSINNTEKCSLCGNPEHDHFNCPHFGFATSADLFKELGMSAEEAEKQQRELNARMIRRDMRENNK